MTLPQASTNSAQEAGDKERPQSGDEVCVRACACVCVRACVCACGWMDEWLVAQRLKHWTTPSLEA